MHQRIATSFFKTSVYIESAPRAFPRLALYTAFLISSTDMCSLNGIDVSPTPGTNDEQLVLLTNKELQSFFPFSKTS